MAEDKTGNETGTPGGDELARRLLRQGKVRAALNRAKTVHKVRPSADTEMLLLRCYAARIEELRGAGQEGEAKRLEDFVAMNFPGRAFPPADLPEEAKSVSQTVGEQSRATEDDPLGDALRRLTEAEIPDSDRQAAENDVARLAFDPVVLAEHPALTDGHPLAAAAKAVAVAFADVVSKPIGEDEIALPEISRRSPFAGWKLLVRAIFHLQRREDQLAGQALDGLAKLDSAAARLVPALRAIASGSWDKLDGAEKRILSAWRQREKRLPEALRRFDAVFFAMLPRGPEPFELRKLRKKEKDLHAALRNAAEAIRLEAPTLTPVFRENAAAKMLIFPDVPLSKIEKSLGGPVARSASFWRLAALAVEERINLWNGGGADLAELRDCWTAFLRQGVAEGLFPGGGAEEAEIWLRLADMAMERGADDKSASIDPMEFFANAAAAHPTSEMFRTWLNAARRLDADSYGWRKRGPGKNDDRPAWVLEEWTRLLPNDPAPFLMLMDEAERRNALSLAQKHLAAAEALDPLNADLTRAKWRLTLAMCRRHLKQGKAHLVEADLKKLKPLRRFGPENAGWLLIGLHRLLAITMSDQADKLHDELVEAVGGGEAGQCAAGLIEEAVGVYSSRDFFLKPPTPISPPAAKTEDVVLAAARVFRLLAQTNFALAWGKKSSWPAWIASVGDSWPEADLPVVIRTLIPGKFFDEAFALTSPGLAKAERTAAAGRLLFLRAVILDAGRTYQNDRIFRCAHAALEIGRRTGDRALMAETLSWMRGENADSRFYFDADGAARPMADDELDEVFEIERKNSSFPKPGTWDPHEEFVERRMDAEEAAEFGDDDDDFDDGETVPGCPRPKCRRAGGETPYASEGRGFDIGKAMQKVLEKQVPQFAEHIASILERMGFSTDGADELADAAAPELALAAIMERPVGDDIFDFYQFNPDLREKSLEIASGLSRADRRLFEENDRRAAARRASSPKKTKRGRGKKR